LVPSVVAVHATDQAHYDEADYHTGAQQPPPLALTDFTAVDDGPSAPTERGKTGPHAHTQRREKESAREKDMGV
jgi:hypothetical protein